MRLLTAQPMNYNSYSFWLLFAAVYLWYWRLDHKRQNTLLLVASYIFYATWDYRFLFLILISTVIDFIGGLGVAGKELSRRRLWELGGLLVGSALLLCTNIRYDTLIAAVSRGDLAGIAAALPHRLSDFYVPLGAAAVSLAYGAVIPRLCAAEEGKRRKTFLVISMVANLAILGFFKYCDFFITSAYTLVSTIGLGQLHWSALGILLPAGISFYTFQAMSYTIDIFRGDAEPTGDFRDFALFVCFFPHLVAGPIMRAHTLLPQVLLPRRLRAEDLSDGLLLVVIGLFKKIVIADNMAPIANAIFSRFAAGDAAGVSGAEALVGIYAFAFQIYGDFSGYSSIARGISKWLGFELVVNFRMPYLAVSPSDFWRRWHISLSTWLRDYLYVPLGGNRRGTAMLYRNLMLTMLLGGLWHGASWTFVAWGLYHGTLLCVFKWLNVPDEVPVRTPGERLRWLGRVGMMFHLTCAGWLLFRADSFASAFRLGVRILTDFRVTEAAVAAMALIVFYSALMFALEWMMDGERRLERLTAAPWPARAAAYAYLVVMLLLFPAGHAHAFIYFQF
jgi:alginate O-acetyltransferase complex protein AlgI